MAWVLRKIGLRSEGGMTYALRQLQKNPKFVLVAMLTLALGIGINTTTFSLVYLILYRMPPYADPGRLVQVFAVNNRDPSQSPANVHDELAQATHFEHAAAFTYAMSNLARPGEPADRINGLQVGGDYFRILGLQPLLGRTLGPADDTPGTKNVVVVSERFWREKLGARPDALGTVLRLDAKPVTVVGVMPESAQDLITVGVIELWQPLGYDSWANRTNTWLSVVARLKPGATLGEARSEMSAIAKRLAHDYPDNDAGMNLGVKTYLQLRHEATFFMSWTIMGLMLAVLLIACVNLANLQLARTAERIREFAVRIALGASRGQLIRHLLAESVLVSLLGGALGLLVAVWGNRLLGSRLHLGDDAGVQLPLAWPILIFTLAASVGTGILFGLMPAVIASRTDVQAGLKQGGRGSAGSRKKHRTRQILVIAEVALALALLTGAAYFVRGIQRINGVRVNWPTEHLITGQVVPPWSTYTNNDQLRAVTTRMEAELRSILGVDHAALSISLPIFGLSGLTGFEIEGRPTPEKGHEPLLYAERVTPDYFATLGIPILAGRGFTAADRGDAKSGVMVISKTMADTFWPKGDALGHRIGTLLDPKKPDWREIVGIVGNVQFHRIQTPGETRYQTYHPLAQEPDHYLTFTIRGVGATATLFEEARRAITRADPDIAVFYMSTVDQIIDRSQADMVLIGQLLTIAALIGLLLALLGIYGVVAHLAIQRTQEIGIRIAVGAQSRDILWLILRNGIVLASIGTAIGLLLALGLTKALALAIPNLPGKDPGIVAGLAVLLVGATLAACWFPARRATRIDPIVALRED